MSQPATLSAEQVDALARLLLDVANRNGQPPKPTNAQRPTGEQPAGRC